MSNFDGAFERIGIDSKSVVLRRDLHLSSRQIHHRLIAAGTSKAQLSRARAKLRIALAGFEQEWKS